MCYQKENSRKTDFFSKPFCREIHPIAGRLRGGPPVAKNID